MVDVDLDYMRRRVREDTNLLREVMGEELWARGKYVDLIWSSDNDVIAVMKSKGGEFGVVLGVIAYGLVEVDLGDPDLVNKVRTEIRRLLG